MPNPNYKKGARAEYREAVRLRALGYIVTRNAGSHGPYDLVAINVESKRILLVQVKTGKHAEAERIIATQALSYFNGIYEVKGVSA